jgi:hypothetical protein
MNAKDAAYHTVHDYEGGSESLSPRVGISAAVLRNKVNPNNDTHHLTYAEAIRITGITGDVRMIEAWAALHDRVLVKLPDAGTSDMDVLSDCIAMQTQLGRYMQEIQTALQDGKVDKAEIAIVRQQALITQARVAALVSCLEGMSE